jgi:hypothetical protein
MKFLLAIGLLLMGSLVAFADDTKNLLKPVNSAESWRLEQHERAVGSLIVLNDATVINSSQITGTDWHLQAFQTNLDLKDGQTYTLKLRLASSQRRSLVVVAGIDKEDWHDIGLREEISVDTEGRLFEFTFRASDVAPNQNRIGFVLGNELGDVIVKEMTLTEATDGSRR